MITGKETEKRRGVFSWYFESNLLLRILIGLVLGAVVGIVAGPSIFWVKPFGSLFVNLLKMIVMPVVLATLTIGAASISPAELGKVVIKITLYYLITSAFAAAIAISPISFLKDSSRAVEGVSSIIF